MTGEEIDAGLIDSISDGYLVPIVSGSFVNELVFESHAALAVKWATQLGYSTMAASPASLTLAGLSQYHLVQTPGPNNTALAIKRQYMNFIKNEIDARARGDWGVSQTNLAEMRAQFRNLTASGLLRKCERPPLDSEEQNPLLYLASMPLPVYLTTSYHDCLEVVLKEFGKKRPRSEICYWHRDLRGIKSVFEEEPNYTPTAEDPLVLHLFGWDKHPQSLVLTEDDCLDFLANVPCSEVAIPKVVKSHLTLSSVAMLGFGLRDWEFRVVFRGVIGALERIQGTRIAIQLEDETADTAYLEKYLRLVAFDVAWKKPGEFIAELFEGWGGES